MLPALSPNALRVPRRLLLSNLLAALLASFAVSAPAETLTQLHFLIRKAGHFVEYFVLSLLVLRGLRGPSSGWRWSWGLMALLICAGYAVTDEFHQYFEAGRGAAWPDVLLDSAGAAVAQLAAALRREKPKNETTVRCSDSGGVHLTPETGNESR